MTKPEHLELFAKKLPSCHTSPSTSSSGTPQFKAIFSLQHLHPDGTHDMREPFVNDGATKATESN